MIPVPVPILSERDRALLRLRAEGLSATAIAARLEGLTRNAVLGRVHRLKAAGVPIAPARKRPAATVAKPRTVKPAKVVKEKPIKVAAPAPSAPPAPSVPPVAAEDGPQGRERADLSVFVAPDRPLLALADLHATCCHWPFDAPEGGVLFCGDPARDGSPYCADHAAVARGRSRRRRRATLAAAPERTFAAYERAMG